MSPIEIIAEIANAHQGDPTQAATLARLAAEAGADAVKFQVYTAAELLTRSHPRYAHFEKQAFSREEWTTLLAEARSLNATVYCDVFGLESLAMVGALGVDHVKIHSSDMGNLPLLQQAARVARRILLGAGGCGLREIARAVRTLREAAPAQPPQLVLLHGFQSYPTAIEDTRLERLLAFRNEFGDVCEVGYMDHVAGDDPMAFHLPLMAAAMGATVLEKHVTLDRAAQGVDYYSSLEPAELAAFVTQARRAETALAGGCAAFSEPERQYRRATGKHWVAARALPAGRVLAGEDLVMKRDVSGDAYPAKYERLVGRPLLRDVQPDEPLCHVDVRQTVFALPVARSASSRLPGKALIDVAGTPALRHLLERLKQAARLDAVVFCTTVNAEDDALAEAAAAAGLPCHRGPVEDVLGRMLGALDMAPQLLGAAAVVDAPADVVDVVVRVTGDDILVDPDYLDETVRQHLAHNAEYTSAKDLPSGVEVEVFDAQILRDIHHACKDAGGTEYLTFYVTRNPDHFLAHVMVPAEAHRRDWRLTLDTPEDYQVITAFLEAMRAQGKALDYRMDDLVAFYAARPDVLAINAQVRQRSAPIEVCTDICWSRLGHLSDEGSPRS